MATFRSSALALALALALPACSKAPSSEQCERLAAHLVSLAAKSESASKADSEKVSAAVGTDLQGRCEKSLSVERVECALKAQSLTEVEACDADPTP